MLKDIIHSLESDSLPYSCFSHFAEISVGIWQFFWGADVWRSPPERAGQVPGLLLPSSWVAMSSLRAILAGSLCQASFVWKSWQTQRNMAPETTEWLSRSNSSEGGDIDNWLLNIPWHMGLSISMITVQTTHLHLPYGGLFEALDHYQLNRGVNFTYTWNL